MPNYRVDGTSTSPAAWRAELVLFALLLACVPGWAEEAAKAAGQVGAAGGAAAQQDKPAGQQGPGMPTLDIVLNTYNEDPNYLNEMLMAIADVTLDHWGGVKVADLKPTHWLYVKVGAVLCWQPGSLRRCANRGQPWQGVPAQGSLAAVASFLLV
jgi:hypothetical protein